MQLGPGGFPGRVLPPVAGYAPPAPDFAQPPLLWWSKPHVRERFAGTGIHLEFDREVAPAPRYATGYAAVDFGAANFGPLTMLRDRLETTGEWPMVRDELARLYADSDPPEYLVVTGHKR